MKKTQQKCAKSEKTRAQKDAHNQHCKQYRQRVKRRREDLETENREMKLELEVYESKIREMGNDNQQLREALEEKNRNEKRMRQNPIEYKGQIFNSSDELAEWLLSQKYVHDGQASLGSLDGFGSETGNLPLYTADFDQQLGFDQDYTNTASAANHVGSSSAAYHVGSSSATGAWINSVAEFDWSEFDFTNQHDNIFINDLAAGVPNHSAAVPSLGPNSELPIAPDAKNNHGNAYDLFTHDPDADLGFQ